jgi:multidrug efflux pump subunit AcrA (membrane-fusion protein)
MIRMSVVDPGVGKHFVGVETTIGMPGRLASRARLQAPGFCMILIALVAAGCGPQAAAPPEIRPVRAVKAERRVHTDRVALTGEIKAQEEAPLGFRYGGRMIERLANVGDQLVAGQLIARLDPQPADNAAKSADADVTAAAAVLAEAQSAEQRQRQLVDRGVTTRAAYESTLRQLQTAQSPRRRSR